MTQLSQPIQLFTDGACQGNPGPGGYAAILRGPQGEQEITGGYIRTTNNRMELLAVIRGLESLTAPTPVVVYTDSQYVVNGITLGWAAKWRANRWIKSDKKPALNPDLWGRLLDLCAMHQVTFQWVRGHSGHPENERCDRLAVAVAKRPDLPPDPKV